MPDRPAYWNPRVAADRVEFMRALRPLVVASKTKDFDDPGDAKTHLTLWMLAFADVPRDVFLDACARQFMRAVVFMPRHGELKHLCADIVDERRTAIAHRVAEMKATCAQQRDGLCNGTWFQVGFDVDRCACHARGLAMLAEVASPITRPQLPESTEVA